MACAILRSQKLEEFVERQGAALERSRDIEEVSPQTGASLQLPPATEEEESWQLPSATRSEEHFICEVPITCDIGGDAW